MKFSVALIAAVASLVSAAPAPGSDKHHHHHGLRSFALRLSAPGTTYDGCTLSVHGDVPKGVNYLVKDDPGFTPHEFQLVPAGHNPNKGYLYYGGFTGSVSLYAGFESSNDVTPLQMVNSGNPNPTNFLSGISFDGYGMKVNGEDAFFMCPTQKTDGTTVDALNWDNSGYASFHGCTKVTVVQG